MLYDAYEWQRSLLAGASAFANAGAELLSNPATPLNNKAVAGQYPPGSTFKPVHALAILEAGISPEDTVVCGGGDSLDGCV